MSNLSQVNSNHSSEDVVIDLDCQAEDESSPSNTHLSMARPANKKKNFSCNKKREILEMLLKESKNGKLPRGMISKVADHFLISLRSVSRILQDGKQLIAEGRLPYTYSMSVKRIGRRRVEIDLEKIKDIPLRRRTNIRSLSNAMGVPKSTLHRRIKEGYIIAHSSALKPLLSDDNKTTRLEFCLSMIDEGTLSFKPPFVDMFDRIHIDEKWFFMSKTSQNFYLHPEEKQPYRTCKSKRFIAKIMFLAAVARPRFDSNSNREFDGKIGIWPFVFKDKAKRNSKNRAVGTLETKPVLSITKETIRSCLIEKLLPSIKEKWPCSSSGTIFIQQDNARPHLNINDTEFLEAVRKAELDVQLFCQPPNSPDMNVLDLGFFRAIDSLQHQEAPTTIDEFISAVEHAFDIFLSKELNNVFFDIAIMYG